MIITDTLTEIFKVFVRQGLVPPAQIVLEQREYNMFKIEVETRWPAVERYQNTKITGLEYMGMEIKQAKEATCHAKK